MQNRKALHRITISASANRTSAAQPNGDRGMDDPRASVAGGDRLLLQKAESYCPRMSGIALRCAQPESRCAAARNRGAKLCPDRNVKSPGQSGVFRRTMGQVSPNYWATISPEEKLRVDKSIKNKTRKRLKPLAVQTSTLKKSAATISSQCRVRNFQVVFGLLSGAGSIPCRCRILAIVLRASLCPRLDMAPWMRRYPQARFSSARRTTKVSISFPVRGRPGPRFSCPSYFCAISLLCQANKVSGVTRVATSARSLRPSPLVRAAKRRRWSSLKRNRRSPSSSRRPDSPHADTRSSAVGASSSNRQQRPARTGKD